MKKDKLLQYLPRLFLVLIAMTALISPALINGFPLVYSDSGTYIAAVKTNSIPVDRPIGYSLFLNITSLNISLWFTIMVQSLVLIYLVDSLLKHVLKISGSLKWTSVILTILSFTTGVSNYTSQLMPDIFVSWMILTVFIIFFRKEQNRLHSFLLTLIFILSVISHFSVLLAATALIAMLLIFNAVFKWEARLKVWFLISWLVLGWLAIPLINVSYGERFSISRCKNVSLMARIVETGVAAEFLNENCDTGKYSLCAYRDSLPLFGYLFAWDPSSPLYSGGCWDTGWGNCWIEKDEEYGRLLRDIVSSPKYVKKLIKISAGDTYRQLIDFRIGVLVPMTEESAPFGTIKSFYPQHLESYKKAEQYQRILYFILISNIQLVLVVLTLIFVPLFFMLLVNRKYAKQVFQLTLIIGIGLLLNAAVCSTFSTVVDRYQSRVIWMVPFLFMVMVITLLQNKKLSPENYSPH